MNRELTYTVEDLSENPRKQNGVSRSFALDRLRKVDHLAVYVAALMIACAGLAGRVVLLFLSGNLEVGPFSGVGDQLRYLTLADSIFQGKGFTYAGQPTALRPPLYPLLLAGFHVLFGAHYLVAVRILQFLAGIALAVVCALLASRFFGKAAGTMAGAIALAFPTLVFVSTELQTENLASLLTVFFLFFLLGDAQSTRKGAASLGLIAGVAALLRFNGAILSVIGVLVYLYRRSFQRALVLAAASGLVVAPWLLHNFQAFHGKVLFSSHGGINLLEGVLTPDGRAQKGEDERVRSLVGWLHTDIEQNSSHRLLFASEDQLDRQARVAAGKVWKGLDWTSRVKLLSVKFITFWFSTDQLLETSSFSARQRTLRAIGVTSYWFLLALALIGWRNLFSSSAISAQVLCLYTAVITFAHMPFVMNTRLRIPFIDPFLPVIAAGGIWHLYRIYKEHATAGASADASRPLDLLGESMPSADEPA